MSKLARAKKMDAEDSPVAAAALYEEALLAGESEYDVYIDLAVLYFVCCDGGYSAHHHLDEKFMSLAWRRSRQLLNEAQLKFGATQEIIFWRRYFDFVQIAEPPEEERWGQMVKSGATMLPYLYLFGQKAWNSESDAATLEQLHKDVMDGATARKRYIKGVAEGMLKRYNFARDHSRKT